METPKLLVESVVSQVPRKRLDENRRWRVSSEVPSHCQMKLLSNLAVPRSAAMVKSDVAVIVLVSMDCPTSQSVVVLLVVVSVPWVSSYSP